MMSRDRELFVVAGIMSWNLLGDSVCGVESDDSTTPFPLVMAMRFATRQDIKIALESPVRWKSKETSKKLFDMFNGIVIHTVFEANQVNLIS